MSVAGDLWSVKLDVRDLGGHLDVTYRAPTTLIGGRNCWSLGSCDGGICLAFGLYG